MDCVWLAWRTAGVRIRYAASIRHAWLSHCCEAEKSCSKTVQVRDRPCLVAPVGQEPKAAHLVPWLGHRRLQASQGSPGRARKASGAAAARVPEPQLKVAAGWPQKTPGAPTRAGEEGPEQVSL